MFPGEAGEIERSGIYTAARTKKLKGAISTTYTITARTSKDEILGLADHASLKTIRVDHAVRIIYIDLTA